jgi:hypothetical protein
MLRQHLRFSMTPLLFFLFLLAPVSAASAATNLLVRLTTGSDDLRGGNNAFIRLNLTDGTSTATERRLGGGFGQNSVVSKCVTFSETLSLNQIRSVTIRHDGSPRPGQPFDNYDNWDLQALTVSLADSRCNPVSNIYNSANDPRRRRFVQRFTGDTRQIVLRRQPR